MKKILLLVILLCSVNLHGNPLIGKNRNTITTNRIETGDEEWKPWATVQRAYAYYKSTGERCTEYDYGLDLYNCPVERRIVNGYAQYRIKIMLGGWKPVKKSYKKGYKYCFEDGDLIYYFNM